MSQDRLAPQAVVEIDELFDYRASEFGDDSATQLSGALTDAFERLAASPGLGHRRQDLTSKPYFFYSVPPYLIVYQRGEDPLPILRVLHSSRDARKLLKARTRR